MDVRPLRTPICALVVAALSAAVAGCGGEPVARVRVLQIEPATFIARKAAAPATGRVNASLTEAAAPVPAPVHVPQVGSIAVGAPNRGSLVNGLQLPESGPDWLTWDAILHRSPNRPERRWGTDRLLAFLLGVLRDYRLANPSAPPVLVGDLSRPYGGPFGSDYGGLGHASHQNGLDVDVLYPRADRALAPAATVQEVDRALAQDLVNRFVAAGAQFAFVGRHVGLGGPPGVVQAIAHHDDHVHVRIPNARR
ncbi:MAG: penicillin-insensitive murein DD-endopeptidase [bacterium]|jgi:murein endopeptidase